MNMSVTYTNFLGGIVAENRGGVQSYYVPDTLGSTVALVDTSATVTDAWTYWPYGEVQSRTGTTPTPFAFLGALGYYQDVLNTFSYVRARVLRPTLTQWQTVDKFWPSMRPYGYCAQRPTTITDRSGNELIGAVIGCAIGGLAGGIGSYLGGGSAAKTACVTAADCAAGGFGGGLITEDPSIGACLAGGVGAAIGVGLERLCEILTSPQSPAPSPCSRGASGAPGHGGGSGSGSGRGPGNGSEGNSGSDGGGPDTICNELTVLVGAAVACIGAGEAGADALIGLVQGLVGGDCKGFGNSIVPGG